MKPKTTVEYLVEEKVGKEWVELDKFVLKIRAQSFTDGWKDLDRLMKIRIIRLTTTSTVKREVVSDMTEQRWMHMMSPDTEERLTPEEIAQGYHFCHEFDGLLRSNHNEEFQCICMPKDTQ